MSELPKLGNTEDGKARYRRATVALTLVARVTLEHTSHLGAGFGKICDFDGGTL